MNNIVTTNTVTGVVVVTAPGPLGPRGFSGSAGPPGTINSNSGLHVTGSSFFDSDVYITGSLTVSSSNTFTNIGVANFTGSVNINGSLIGLSASFSHLSGSFIGDGSQLTNIPASSISGLNLNRIASGSVSASVSPTGKAFNLIKSNSSIFSVDQFGSISGSGLNISSNTYDTVINTPNINLIGNATLNGQPITTAGDLTLNQIKSGTVTASVSAGQNSFTVQNGASTLMTVSSSGYVSASGFIGDGSRLSNVGITYLSGSNPLINSIEVADFDNNVAVTYVGGNLKFIFGTPAVPSAPQISFNGTFNTDRFNLQTDNYTATATWAVGGYSLVRASMVDLSTGTEVASTTSGTSLPFNTTTAGNQSYRIAVTASSPLDGTINIQTATVPGTLSKLPPSDPVLTPTANVQLGTTSGIESGATGSISFTAVYGASDNGWEKVSLVSSSNSPITVTATNTPSATLTSNYQSPAGTNSPTATTSRNTSFSYNRIISVRYGASSAESFDLNQLQDLALWDTTLGGTIGTIAKGTIDPNNYQFTVTTSGNYIYIVIPSGYTLTGILNVNNSNANDISVFRAPVTIGGYKVYRSNNVSATTILYKLTT